MNGIFLVYAIVYVSVVLTFVDDVWFVGFVVPFNKSFAVGHLGHALCDITLVGWAHVLNAERLRGVEGRQVVGLVTYVFFRLVFNLGPDVIGAKAEVHDEFRVTDRNEVIVAHRVRLFSEEKLFYH
jgi:hypothetical protein